MFVEDMTEVDICWTAVTWAECNRLFWEELGSVFPDTLYPGWIVLLVWLIIFCIVCKGFAPLAPKEALPFELVCSLYSGGGGRPIYC